MVTRIYDRPDLDQRRGLPALYVTGVLPGGKPGLAYQGRLQIHNSVGACTVEQIDGDTLPPGHTIFVDNDTMEVVITWPAYAEEAAPIPNSGFEDGIVGWVPGAGWSVTTNNAIAGSRSAVYQRNGGSSVLSSQSRYPTNPGVPINAQCQVRQGASSAGNAGAGLRLEFRDAAGDVIGRADGNYVMSASKNAVYPSNVAALPPQGAATVNIACVGVRHRENKDVWVDSFSWDHKVAVVGINTDALFNLTLRVRDSAGRTAIWRGLLQCSNSSPEIVWTNRGSNAIVITETDVVMSAETTGAGFTGANAYSQPLNYSSFVVGSTISYEFSRAYAGPWWDDIFVNSKFSTALMMSRVGQDVQLKTGMWEYEDFNKFNDPANNGISVVIEWRRTYDLAPKVVITSKGGELIFSDMATEINPGHPSENTSCHIKVDVSRPVPDTITVDVHIDGVHRYSATGSGVSIETMEPSVGCMFAHAHNYGGAAIITIADAVILGVQEA